MQIFYNILTEFSDAKYYNISMKSRALGLIGIYQWLLFHYYINTFLSSSYIENLKLYIINNFAILVTPIWAFSCSFRIKMAHARGKKRKAAQLNKIICEPRALLKKTRHALDGNSCLKSDRRSLFNRTHSVIKTTRHWAPQCTHSRTHTQYIIKEMICALDTHSRTQQIKNPFWWKSSHHLTAAASLCAAPRWHCQINWEWISCQLPHRHSEWNRVTRPDAPGVTTIVVSSTLMQWQQNKKARDRSRETFSSLILCAAPMLLMAQPLEQLYCFMGTQETENEHWWDRLDRMWSAALITTRKHINSNSHRVFYFLEFAPQGANYLSLFLNLPQEFKIISSKQIAI